MSDRHNPKILKAEIEANAIGRVALARAAGVSRTTIYRLMTEAGSSSLTWRNIESIREALDRLLAARAREHAIPLPAKQSTKRNTRKGGERSAA